MIKYRVFELAKDFNKKTQEIIDLLGKFCPERKTHGTVLTEEELNFVFETFTQESEIENFDEYSSDTKSDVKKKDDYNQQPTLLVGLGGFGSRITDNIYGRVKDVARVSAFAIDADNYDSANLKNIPSEHVISIAQPGPLSQYVPYAKEWFPRNPLLIQKALSECFGQVRAISRLAYEISLAEKRFESLVSEVNRLAELCVESGCDMRVSVVATLMGGTASGIFMQVALFIREHINKYFPSLNIQIYGELILPSTFLVLEDISRTERRHLEANAYAALKELNAVNRHFFNNEKALEFKYGYHQDNSKRNIVDALPYDYCFLYDRINLGKSIGKAYIENAVIERLFSENANFLNDAFTNNLNLGTEKRAGNLYGVISTEKLPLGTPIIDSEIFRAIINRTSTEKGKRLLLVHAPKEMRVDTDLLPQGTVFIERIDASALDITVTELGYGIEISDVGKLKLNSGQYYISYHKLIDHMPMAVTPHISADWHTELQDIGETVDFKDRQEVEVSQHQKIPKDRFVFISYSSRDIEIANQVKYVLKSNGITCWMAPQSIPAGSDYAVEIPAAIEKCQALLLILSEASQRSNWAPKEVGMAIGKGKIVIPFHIDDSIISAAFDFYLTNSQRISAYNRMTEAYKELLNRLRDILS